MKYLIFCLLLAGCAVSRPSSIVFLKEDESVLYNLQGQHCFESGYQYDKNNHRLITFYRNCDVHKQRTLKELEIKHWAPPKNSFIDGTTNTFKGLP